MTTLQSRLDRLEARIGPRRVIWVNEDDTCQVDGVVMTADEARVLYPDAEQWRWLREGETADADTVKMSFGDDVETPA
jgi:hypothetical protein